MDAQGAWSKRHASDIRHATGRNWSCHSHPPETPVAVLQELGCQLPIRIEGGPKANKDSPCKGECLYSLSKFYSSCYIPCRRNSSAEMCSTLSSPIFTFPQVAARGAANRKMPVIVIDIHSCMTRKMTQSTFEVFLAAYAIPFVVCMLDLR